MSKEKSVTSPFVPGGGDVPDGTAFPGGGDVPDVPGGGDVPGGCKGPFFPLDDAAAVGVAPLASDSNFGRFATGSATS